MARLREALNVEKLMSEGVEFEIDLDNIPREEDIENNDDNYRENLLKFSNLNCLDGAPLDEDTYNDGEPFDNLAKQMFNLVGNGGVKKRVIREGYGNTPPDQALVRIDYNAYLEYEPEPFDSTYARNRKHEFTLNTGGALAGVDLAVQSMRLSEKSQFLVKPEYAYGAMGCLGRIPKNATILFEIELFEVIDSGAALKYDKLTEEKQKDFSEIFKYGLALCTKGNEKFKKRYYKDAVKDYNVAVAKLETAIMNDINDQQKQEELLLRLYTNLLISNVKIEDPRKGCIAVNKIYDLTRNTGEKVQAKVLYNHSRCLRMLGDHDRAKEKLRQAQRVEPRNPHIANEFISLEAAIAEYKKKEAKVAQAFISDLKSDSKTTTKSDK